MTAPTRRPRTAPGGSLPRRQHRGRAGRSPAAAAPAAPPRRQLRGGRGRRADPVRRLALRRAHRRRAAGRLRQPAAAVDARRARAAGRDAALATELTYGTLRGRGSYDAILGLCSDRALDRVDPPLREVLRLGTHQLLATRVARARGRRDVRGPRPGPGRAAARPGSSTRCSAGWPPGTWRPGSGSRRRAATPTRSVTWPSATAIPAGWSRRWPRRWGRMPQAVWPGPRRPWRPTGPGPGSRCAWCPAWPTPRSSWPPAAQPAAWSPFGAYLAGRGPGRDRGPSAAAARPSRTRRASSPRSRSPGWSWPAPDRRWLDLCAGPGRQGPAARPGWRRSAGRTCWPRTRARTGPGWPATRWRSPARRPPRPWTRPRPPGGRGRSTGCWPTSRAPVSGPCAAARRPAGAGPPQDVLGLGGLQRNLLRSALDAVRPGGVVGYVTCSPHRAETRDVLADVLARPGRHRGARRARRPGRGAGPALPGT